MYCKYPDYFLWGGGGHDDLVVEYKNLTRVSGMDRQICPEGHILASRGSPRDAKL